MTTNITLLTIAVGDILLPGEGSNAGAEPNRRSRDCQPMNLEQLS